MVKRIPKALIGILGIILFIIGLIYSLLIADRSLLNILFLIVWLYGALILAFYGMLSSLKQQ